MKETMKKINEYLHATEFELRHNLPYGIVLQTHTINIDGINYTISGHLTSKSNGIIHFTTNIRDITDLVCCILIKATVDNINIRMDYMIEDGVQVISQGIIKFNNRQDV